MTPIATNTPSIQAAAAALSPSQPSVAGSLVELMAARLDDSFDRRALVNPLCSADFQERGEWTWGETIAAAVDLAEHFLTVGLKSGDRLVHQGTHSVDWIVVDLACLLSGVVHAALHVDASTAEQISQIHWLAPRGIALSGEVRRLPQRELPTGTIVIDLRPPDRTMQTRVPAGLRSGNVPQRTADRSVLRAAVQRRVAACDPSVCATILLSSGTSGRPHGVLHCQRALVTNAQGSAAVFLDDSSDVRLSWLPMSHALARVGDLYTALVRGSCLSVVSDRRRILEACRAVPPTVVLGVPAFFERLERATQAGTIPNLAMAMGGSVRVCVSGGAALRQCTAETFGSRGVPLVQGYGLAEAGPVVSICNPRNARPGTVGPPLEGVELKIDLRPQTRGQLLVRTPSRAIGIIIPQESQPSDDATPATPPSPLEAAEMAEWIQTGDRAEIDTDGQLRITGRLVDTIVLTGGVKVPPAEVERVIAEDASVAQVCVIGEGLAWTVALIVPDPQTLRQAIKRMGVRVFSRRAALTHPAVLAWFARRIARRQQGLPHDWRVRRVVLVGRAFDALHGEATESLKLKRRVIMDHFQWVQIAALKAQPPAWMAVVGKAAPDRTHAKNQTDKTANSRIPNNSLVSQCVWHSSDCRDRGRFHEAAIQAARPLRDAVAAVVEQADRVLAHLRGDDQLYDPTVYDPTVYEPTDFPTADSGEVLTALTAQPTTESQAILGSRLEKRHGKFSRHAEEALGEIGFWGLAVPEAFGGSGCTMLELTRAITRLAVCEPTAAGMLSVHSSIGAVSALIAFGSPQQQSRHLPGLAQGRPLSIFGATEPQAGCDLGAIRSVLERCDGRLLLSGRKQFITGATYGRLVKLLAIHEGRPTVVLVRLPATDTATFSLRRYGLHPLKHAHNNGLDFRAFNVDEVDILQPPESAHSQDGMQIVWHGINRGRVTLAAQAAGTLRMLLAGARDYSLKRCTWGQPIAARELVQGRLARMAASTIACDSLATWAAAAIDDGQSGELEAIIAKIIASQCVREAAIEAIGVHGGRAFLTGHPLGDSLHDHLAVSIYEGESDLLGLALFKGLCKHHPLALQGHGASRSRRVVEWLAWRTGRWLRSDCGMASDRAILDRVLREHACGARRMLAGLAVRIDRMLRRYGKSLADRQLEIAAVSAEVQQLTSVLATTHYADAVGNTSALLAADCWCRMALARARGRKLTAADQTALAALGKSIVKGDTLDGP